MCREMPCLFPSVCKNIALGLPFILINSILKNTSQIGSLLFLDCELFFFFFFFKSTCLRQLENKSKQGILEFVSHVFSARLYPAHYYYSQCTFIPGALFYTQPTTIPSALLYPVCYYIQPAITPSALLYPVCYTQDAIIPSPLLYPGLGSEMSISPSREICHLTKEAKDGSLRYTKHTQVSIRHEAA